MGQIKNIKLHIVTDIKTTMEENENNGVEHVEKGNVIAVVADNNPVLVLSNGTNHLHQIENTLVAQKHRNNNNNNNNNNNTENGMDENDPVIIKPYTNGNGVHNGGHNGVHDDHAKPYTT